MQFDGWKSCGVSKLFYRSWQPFKSSLHQAFPFFNLPVPGAWTFVLLVHETYNHCGWRLVHCALCVLGNEMWNPSTSAFSKARGCVSGVPPPPYEWCSSSNISRLGASLSWGSRDPSGKVCVSGGLAWGATEPGSREGPALSKPRLSSLFEWFIISELSIYSCSGKGKVQMCFFLGWALWGA